MQKQIVIDLSEVTLVDKPSLQFLAAQVREDIKLMNCPEYIEPWIDRESFVMRYFVFAVALATAGCTRGTQVRDADHCRAGAFKEGVPPNFKEAPGWKAGEPKDDLHRGKWWEIFGDPQLNALEEQIDINNQTLAAAEAQFRGARASIRVSRSALYPTLSGGASSPAPAAPATSDRSPTAAARSNTRCSRFPTVSASWEPDLWGQVASAD